MVCLPTLRENESHTIAGERTGRNTSETSAERRGVAPDCGGPSLVGRTFLSASGRRVRGVLTPPNRPEEMRKGQECPCGERADRNVCPTKSPQTRVTPERRVSRTHAPKPAAFRRHLKTRPAPPLTRAPWA